MKKKCFFQLEVSVKVLVNQFYYNFCFAIYGCHRLDPLNKVLFLGFGP